MQEILIPLIKIIQFYHNQLPKKTQNDDFIIEPNNPEEVKENEIRENSSVRISSKINQPSLKFKDFITQILKYNKEIIATLALHK